MVYRVLFLTGGVLLGVSGEISCFVGRPRVGKGVFTKEKSAALMCSVMFSKPDKELIFGLSECVSPGCHRNARGEPYCCCETHLCNTFSFFYLSSTRSYATQYIAHIVILIIIIAKLLILLIINRGCFHMFDRRPIFRDRIHLDFTEFSIQPRLNSAETSFVIDRICAEATEPIPAAPETFTVNAVLTYSTTDRITYREAKKQAKLVDINGSSPMEDILRAVIRFGPNEIDWSYDVITAILKSAYKTLMEEPTLLELSAPITIYGDLHGQYSDIWRWFHANGWPPDTRCLFLGDYVDRGRHSTEVLLFLLLLKIVLPKSVYLIRGNHEDPPVNKAYNFQSELRTRFSRRLFRRLCRKVAKVYSVMPIACIINEEIFCVHGGLSPRVHTVAEIAALRKPIVTSHKQNLHIDFMWSDPHVDVWTFGPNLFRDPAGVGVGYVFGPIQIRRFLKRNNLSLIVRAHQPPMSGYERIGSHLLTIFSTAGYRVKNDVGNLGASLVIDEDGEMNIVRIQVGEQLKLKRQKYKMDKADYKSPHEKPTTTLIFKGVRYRDCGKPKLKPAIDDAYS